MVVDVNTTETRQDNATDDSKMDEAVEVWEPWNLAIASKNSTAPPPVAVKTAPGPAWDIEQVLKAARLLCKPPMSVEFTDEQEMRSVYSLIYDVFRYKSILDQAIDDVDFFGNYPQLTNEKHTTWLFLMELARRRWMARPRGEVDHANRLLSEAGPPFKDVESAVWEERVHFAAAIARIRIKNKAFSLSELLPPHLREEKISACVNKETVTGWVNTFKAKKVAQLVQRLHELGYSYSNSRQLCAGEYRFDREREFCEGASTLCRALRACSLRGVVAQTHASSPRCSAYLAAQLRELASVLKAQAPAAPVTPELGKLVVVESYVGALRELGVDASPAPHSSALVCVLGDAVHSDTPLVLSALDGVVAALATPPNSYSAVTDPIDLILTESDIDPKGRARVQSILEEQKKTLKTLLSKPQIQLILYETHSALEAENQAQVSRAVAEANLLARERHTLLKKKRAQTSRVKESTQLPPTDSGSSLHSAISQIDQNNDADVGDDDSSVRSMSPPAAAARKVNKNSECFKKRAESADVAAPPGSGKSRPIPNMQTLQSSTQDLCGYQSRSQQGGPTNVSPVPATLPAYCARLEAQTYDEPTENTFPLLNYCKLLSLSPIYC
ncbi:unnamed protein product [Leptidea sinapis]|uniref:Uncharacterized protein n=1 Tax=Leptidea sinapis TaxID=189913 RepID=A0A5E4PQ98_9NEOP|nr:unnamed protein product [Leptidea sinapis]